MAKYLKTIEAHFAAPPVPDSAVLSVLDMLNYYLAEAKLPAGGIGKIVVLLDHLAKKESLFNGGDICEVRSPFTCAGAIFSAATLAEKRKLLIEAVVDTARRVLSGGFAEQPTVWDTTVLDNLLQLLQDMQYSFEAYWKKQKWNRPRTRLARIRWSFTAATTVYFHILDGKQQTIMQRQIVILPIGLGPLENILGELSWLDDDTVRLLHSNKRDYWTLHTGTGILNFIYPRAEQGDAHGQYDLAMMYLEGRGVLQDHELAVYWLQQAAAKQFRRAIQQLNKMKNR